MSYCEFCGFPTPKELEEKRFGAIEAEKPQDNWWVCENCNIESIEKLKDAK